MPDPQIRKWTIDRPSEEGWETVRVVEAGLVLLALDRIEAAACDWSCRVGAERSTSSWMRLAGSGSHGLLMTRRRRGRGWLGLGEVAAVVAEWAALRGSGDGE
ncbi:MAG: hypothetical protein U0869_21940 [Chloroflexota bacterium]